MSFKDALGKELLFFDGAMGTMLQANGLKAGELPEMWNITNADVIKSIHSEYINAGANIIKTNTFGANGLKFDNVGEIVSKGVEIAKNAFKDCNKNGFVALDIGPSGKLLKPLGDLEFEKAYDLFSEVAIAGEKAGADLVLIETMSDTLEIKAAVLAVKENTNLPVVVTMIFDDKGRLLTGADIQSAVAMLEGLGVDSIGFNCGLGPKQMLELLPQLVKYSSTPITVNPNAGLPVSINGQTKFNVDPKEFAENMLEISGNPVAIIGGCCGTTPEHIKAMALSCKSRKVIKLQTKNHTVISSYSKSVVFGEKPIIIGERINPTGKKRFKQALRDNDIDYILKEGISQQECGAHVLDVNVGLPEIDEVDVMKTAVKSLQAIIDLPLQIDTSNIAAMESALRVYNGKALINSVNGKKENMESIFPLVKKYGGVVVALTLDENGIPDSVSGRIEIANKIINTAKEYGIDKKNIIVDTLAMTISTGQENSAITLGSLNYIRNTLGVNTVLGVSNVSFGLPQREIINTAFFTMAMENGLSAGIINPMNKSMMTAYDAFCAIKGYDDNCEKYVSKYANIENTPVITHSSEITLEEAIVKGLKDDANACAKALLQKNEPLEIVNTMLVPALDIVGKGFEQNKVFLPQLLMSAEAAKSAFEAIKEFIVKQGSMEQKGDKVVIATVYGDIHDIGKNIVKVLLKNYGYDVIDLGKDVPVKDVVNAVIENDAKLLGLSALMTTTVSSMEDTIKLVKKGKPNCKIMVGGAVLTQKYADMINADYYAKDAMASIHYANKLFNK